VQSQQSGIVSLFVIGMLSFDDIRYLTVFVDSEIKDGCSEFLLPVRIPVGAYFIIQVLHKGFILAWRCRRWS
jgi:hypothetical protein